MSKATKKLEEHLAKDYNVTYRGIRYLRSRTNWVSRDLSEIQKLIDQIKPFEEQGLISGFIQEEQIIITAFNDWIGWVKQVELDLTEEHKDLNKLKSSISRLKNNIREGQSIIVENNTLISLLENMFKHIQNADSTGRAVLEKIRKMKEYIHPLLSHLN